MKVLFFIGNMDHTGGTERVLGRIANGLSRRGYEVGIVSMYGGQHPAFEVDKAIRLHSLGSFYPVGIGMHLHNAGSIFRLVKKESPDVLILVDVILMLYALPAVLQKCRIISWEHFNYYYQFRKNNRIRRIAMAIAVRLSDAYVVLSDEDMGYYRKHFPSCANFHRIYNPHVFDRILSGGAKKKQVLAAGRLTGVKGFDLLLESWKLVEGRNPEWRLIIAGDGEERKNLEKQVERDQLMRVVFTGRCEKMEQLYQEAAVFALSSRYEGFGMVLLEAMQYGVPAVSFACKAGPSEIVLDGENGFLVENGDIKQFAGRLEELMRDSALTKRMGEKAKASVNRFELEEILDQWEKLLESITG